MSDAQAFYSRLFALARVTAFELDEPTAQLYLERLADVSPADLTRALDTLFDDAGVGRPFPSVAAIRKAATGQLPAHEQRAADDADARTAATLIMGAISKHGGIRDLERVRASIGELGWAVVERRGGWQVICDVVNYANMATYEAQFRELARAVIQRRRDGVDDVPPALPPMGNRRQGPTQITEADVLNLLPASVRSRLKAGES